MGKSDAEKELQKYIKTKTSTKADSIHLLVKIREAKDVIDLQIKEEDEGIIKLRVHSTNDKYPKWYTYGYLIDLKNLRLVYKEIKNKEEIQALFLNPNKLVHKPTKSLLDTFDKDYGGIFPDGSSKLFWHNDRFKKKKDPYKVKMKAM
ncbi:MAG: hypothetical protein E4G98_01325 [Promethearchaeota archaeon]|nr:MAG: hypothetical protein E4G98_01325 [Candidatus Lokiarchaeota archaeon]